MSTKLSEATLQSLNKEIRTPKYDRGALKQHIVHLGVGGFHRAHQALYLDDLLELPDTERWAECGIGVLAADVRMRDALQSQDYYYTLVERSAGEPTARVIGSMVDYVLAAEDREEAIERMAHPDTRIVSLTITEGGYFIDDATREFLKGTPDIQHDAKNPHEPKTSIGLISEALDRRRKRNLAPFTVMSCDNVQGNGHVIQKVLLEFAEMHDPSLRQWVAENVTFPNSMVDRITPATTPADKAFVTERFGVDDQWPVVAEPFRQWVIEDNFCNGRPQWERVGAELIQDVAPYEIMKMRLLNGSHLAMAYLGALHGFPFVHEILADDLFRKFIRAFMEEVTPVVPLIPGTSISQYKDTLMERFSNPTINDQVTRLCSEGSAKLPKWLVPSVLELSEKGKPIKILSLVIASWIFYLAKGKDERDQALDIIDARKGELIPIAQASARNPPAFLGIKSIFGDTLPANSAFVSEVTRALEQLQKHSAKEVIQAYLS
jgi:mannitol 2-dehydrogenase